MGSVDGKRHLMCDDTEIVAVFARGPALPERGRPAPHHIGDCCNADPADRQVRWAKMAKSPISVHGVIAEGETFAGCEFPIGRQTGQPRGHPGQLPYRADRFLACAAIAHRKANAAASHADRDGPLAKSTASAAGIVSPYFWAKEVTS